MMQAAGYPLFLYREFRDRQESRLFKKYSKELQAPVSLKGKHILVGIMNFTGTKLSGELAFLRYFYRKGYTVDVFVCSGECAGCTPRVSPGVQSAYCTACTLKCRQLQKRLGGKVNFLKISDFLTKSRIEEIRSEVAARDFLKREDFTWQGIDLHDSIWYGIMRIDLKSSVNYEQDLGKIKTFAVSTFSLSEALGKYFEQTRGNLLGCIVSHGMYHLYGPFLDTANHFHVNGAYWNGAYMRPDTVYFGLNRHIFTAGIFENPKNWEHIRLSEEQKKSIVEKLKWHCPPMPQDFLDRTKKYKKIFGMYANIPWDGAVSNATKGFPDTKTYVAHTLEWFRNNPDCLLIIRSHPCERLKYARKAEKMWDIVKQFDLPENVWYIHPADPIRSYMVADIADASILYGGTMGIELTVAGKIAIQTGYFFWTGKGFLFECEGKDSLYRYLDQVKAGTLKLTHEMYENALRYAWHFTYEWHLDMDYMKPDGKGGYLPVPDEELMKSETLSLIENSLEKGTDIFKKCDVQSNS